MRLLSRASLCIRSSNGSIAKTAFVAESWRSATRLSTRPSLSAPTLAIVNTADEIAPLGLPQAFHDAMPAKNVRIIEYRGEVGVCLQHLGILVGREARAKVWPDIISWLNSRS